MSYASPSIDDLRGVLYSACMGQQLPALHIHVAAMRNDGIVLQQGDFLIMRRGKSCDKLLGKGPWQETSRTRQGKHELRRVKH